VATYTTPSGRSLNKVGVAPNHELVACAPLDALEDCLAADPTALKTPPPPPTALAAP
jgi:C-terminal processing protease CtpA/Prc